MLIKNPAPRKDCISLEAIMVTPEYQTLSPVRRRFVVRYIEQGTTTGVYDAVDAVKYAIGSHIKHIEIRAYQLLRNKAVRQVLDIHFRRSGLESILADLKRAAKKSVKLKLGLTPETAHALIAFEKYVTALEALAAKDKTQPPLNSNLQDSNGGLQ